MTSLAIIPARGGSKRIPRKNILPFCGKPMIGYAIDAARESGVFNRIVVSTDDGEIARSAVDLGAEVPFMRPAALSDDFTPTVPVIAHAIDACRAKGWDFELACCVYPAVPLLDARDLRTAHEMLTNGGSSYVFPVAPFPAAIQRALRRDASGRVQPFQPDHLDTRTQDLEPAYYDAGQFYFGIAAAWLGGQHVHANARTIVLPEWRVVDIDTPADWERAERLFTLYARDR